MSSDIVITKRNGNLENFDLDKIHRILNWACDGITSVSVSDIEMNAKLALRDKISTEEIHQALIKSANDLISEEEPNYQYVAARLLNYWLRKHVWGDSEPPRLLDHIKKCSSEGIYDSFVLESYSESEIHKLGKYIKHKRDEIFTYSGLQQLVDKYLIKNRNTGKIYESPQFAYMMISMTLLAKYEGERRLEYVKKCYDYISEFKINLPTPIMCGVRSPIKQYSSCVLVDVGDSLDSIFASATAVGKYIASRAGIGLNFGRIRPINSPVRGGEVIHTGVIPYLKVFESVVKSTSQNGIRGGSATVNFPFWHYEIEDVVVLKNNAGTDDNRVRKLDYCIQFSKLFYERLIANEDITLFSPHECPYIYDAFGHEDFDEVYKQYENNDRIKFKKKINARKFADLFTVERLETGRIYIMNIDHCNSHNPFLDSIKQVNLCLEIGHPCTPIKQSNDEEGEIGVCVLAAVNWLEVREDEMEGVCDIIVRILDELIDHQSYPVKAAENFCKNRRSIGVGGTNLAAYLAKNKCLYEEGKAVRLTSDLYESLQFFLLKASCNLAKEKGSCAKFHRTRYANGELPIDNYNKNLDKILPHVTHHDWEGLREEIRQHGLRHSTVTAQMPVESSSVIQNSTNGIEPVRSLLSFKKSKKGVLKQLVPNFSKYKNYYSLAFDIKDNSCLLNISAAIQKWIDMAISTNLYYNYEHYDGEIPRSVMVKDMLYAYKLGIKTLYYANSNDGDSEGKKTCSDGGCTL